MIEFLENSTNYHSHSDFNFINICLVVNVKNLFNDPILKKVSFFLLLVTLIVLYLRFSVWYSGITPAEYFSIFIGKSLLEGTQSDILSFYMHSPFPSIIIGILAKIGVESATRITFAFIGILSLMVYFKFLIENVFDKRSAILSLILFSIQSSHIFMSKFISNDLIAFTFFSTSIWLGSAILNKKASYLILITASILYLLSILSYYPLVLFFPIFIVLLYLTNRKSSAIFFGIVSSLLLVYVLIDYNLIISQFDNFVKKQIDISLILNNIESNLYYLSAIIIIFVLAFNNYRRLGITFYKMIAISILAAVMPLFNLILINNYQSYFNLNYSLLFLITFIGVLFKDYLKMGKSMVIAIIVVYITLTIVSFYHVSQFENMQIKLQENSINIKK